MYGESWTVRLLWQPAVRGVAISLLVSGLTVDILSTFYCDIVTVQCIKLTLRIFESGVLLFDCFVYRQNVTYLKRFTRHRHYAGEVEDNHRQTSNSLLNHGVKNYSIELWLMTLC